MTPTGRTLSLLRQSGYAVAVVESWVPGANVRRDLFGFADVLAIHAHRQPRFLLVQCTTAGHVAHRLTKAKRKPGLRTWLAAGGSFEVHGWLCRGGRWHVRRVGVEGRDLSDVLIEIPARRRRRSKQPELFPVAD